MTVMQFLQQLLPQRPAAPLEGSIHERVTPAGLPFVLYRPAPVPGETYPVLYHLHGAMQHWAGVRRAVHETAAQLEAAVAAGACPPMLIVAPHDLSGLSMWADSPDGRQRQASDVDALVAHIDEMPEAQGVRFVQGFSMGGFGAASLARRQPERFRAAIVWDGAMHDWDTLSARRAHIARRQFHGDPAHFARFSPWELDAPGPPLFVVSGALKDYNRRYAEHVAACGGAVAYHSAPVGHSLRGLLDHSGQQAFRFLGERYLAAAARG